MPEGIQTPDGKPLDIDAGQKAFAKAMSAPPADDIPAPPRRLATVEAEASVEAGSSKKADSESKGTRTTPKPPRVKAAPKIKASYADDAQQVVSSVWTVTAALPPTQPFAYVINANAGQLTAALAEGAKHNEGIRNALTGGGEHAWKAQLAIVGLNMAMQAMQLLRDPELRAKAAGHTQAQIAQVVKAATPEGEPDAPDAA